MQFKEGTNVITADGDKAGSIDRIVIDPRTQTVTHVVVRKGFLFTEDKVVPIELVRQANEEQVTLVIDEDEIDELRDFEETHFIPLSPEDEVYGPGYARPLYWYPPAGAASWAYMGYATPGYNRVTEQNIPDNTVAIKEGTDVLSADDEHIGSIEQIITDTQTDQITHLVISQGLLFKDKKLIPAAWMVSATEDNIRLAVDSELIDSLESYKE